MLKPGGSVAAIREATLPHPTLDVTTQEPPAGSGPCPCVGAM